MGKLSFDIVYSAYCRKLQEDLVLYQDLTITNDKLEDIVKVYKSIVEGCGWKVDEFVYFMMVGQEN